MDNPNASTVGDDSQTSSQPGQEGGSPDFATIAKRLDQLEAQLSQANRDAQSSKDKAVAATNKRLNEYGTQLERMANYLTKHKGNVAEAQREMELDDLLAGSRTSISQQAPAAAPQQQPGETIDGDTLKVLGFDPNDAATIAMIEKGFGLQDFVNVAKQRAAQQTNPAPSTLTSVAEGQPQPKTQQGQDALKAEYTKKRDELIKNYGGYIPPVEFASLQLEMRKKGLNI